MLRLQLQRLLQVVRCHSVRSGSVDLTSLLRTTGYNRNNSDNYREHNSTVTLIASDLCPSAPVSVNVVRYDTIQPYLHLWWWCLALAVVVRDRPVV